LKNNNIAIKLIAFILWPLGSIYGAFINYKEPFSKLILVLFIAFYAFTFVQGNEGMDIERYEAEFLNWENIEFSFTGFIYYLTIENSQSLDFIVPFLSFLIFNIFGSFSIYKIIIGLIYGYFYSENIWMLFKYRNINNSGYLSIIIVSAFCLFFPMWKGINATRFPLATQIYFYGVMSYLLTNKKKYFIYPFISIFVHFSFLNAFVVLIVFMLKKIRISFLFYLYVLTIFINTINFESLKSFLSFLPHSYSNKVDLYANDDYASETKELIVNNNWYAKYYVDFLVWAMNITLFSFYFEYKSLIKTNRLNTETFSFILIFASVSNILTLIPSGGRFLMVGYMFLLFYYFMNLPMMIPTKFSNIKNFVFVCLISIFIIVEIRIGFDTMSIMTVFGNPILSIIIESKSAIISLIK
jgi:hypothetical protein